MPVEPSWSKAFGFCFIQDQELPVDLERLRIEGGSEEQKGSESPGGGSSVG